MKNLKLIICILIISANVSIFIYGIIQNLNTLTFLNYYDTKFIENSALILAVHELEDKIFTDTLNNNFSFNNIKINYTITKYDSKNALIRINFKNHFSEFFVNY